MQKTKQKKIERLQCTTKQRKDILTNKQGEKYCAFDLHVLTIDTCEIGLQSIYLTEKNSICERKETATTTGEKHEVSEEFLHNYYYYYYSLREF